MCRLHGRSAGGHTGTGPSQHAARSRWLTAGRCGFPVTATSDPVARQQVLLRLVESPQLGVNPLEHEGLAGRRRSAKPHNYLDENGFTRARAGRPSPVRPLFWQHPGNHQARARSAAIRSAQLSTAERPGPVSLLERSGETSSPPRLKISSTDDRGCQRPAPRVGRLRQPDDIAAVGLRGPPCWRRVPVEKYQGPHPALLAAPSVSSQRRAPRAPSARRALVQVPSTLAACWLRTCGREVWATGGGSRRRRCRWRSGANTFARHPASTETVVGKLAQLAAFAPC